MIAIQFEARKIGLIAEYKKTQEHRDREFELANKCIALVQQKDQIDEEIDQIDANIISQQERHASQQQSFIDDQKRKGKYYFRLQPKTGSNAFFRNLNSKYNFRLQPQTGSNARSFSETGL